MSLYASRNPSRVKALFLNSPIGHEGVPDNYEDLLTTDGIRMSSSLEEPAIGYMLDFWKSQWD